MITTTSFMNLSNHVLGFFKTKTPKQGREKKCLKSTLLTWANHEALLRMEATALGSIDSVPSHKYIKSLFHQSGIAWDSTRTSTWEISATCVMESQANQQLKELTIFANSSALPFFSCRIYLNEVLFKSFIHFHILLYFIPL